MYRKKLKMQFAILGALTLAISGCGGTDKTSESDDSVKVLLVSQLSSSTYGFPEIEPVVLARAKLANENGGLQGRPVEVIVCNDGLDVNKATACARKAVEQKVAAVLSTSTTMSEMMLPILEKAGIPYVNSPMNTPMESSSPVSFPFTGGYIATGARIGKALIERGCKKVAGVGYDGVPTQIFLGAIRMGVESQGAEWGGNTIISRTAADLSPTVSELTGRGVDCIGASLPSEAVQKIVAASSQSGKRLIVGGSSVSFSESIIKDMGESAEGFVIVSTQLSTADDDHPAVQEMVEKMKSVGLSDGDINGLFSVQAWAGASILFGAMEKAEGLNAKGVLEALGAMEEPATTLYGKFTTAEEFDLEKYPRMFNRSAIAYVVEDAVMTRVDKEFQDMSDVIRDFGPQFLPN